MATLNDMKEKYVLFKLGHIASLYQYMTLKYLKYKNDKIILMSQNKKFTDSDFADTLVKNEIFVKIIWFDDSIVQEDYDEIQSEKYIIEKYDKIFEDNKLQFCDIKEIVVSSDTRNFFAVYCSIKNQPLVFLEMYDNQFNEDFRYTIETIYNNKKSWFENLLRKYSALSGDYNNVKKRYLCKNSNIKYKEKDEIIDFLKFFYNLPNDFRQIISKSLCTKNLDFSSEINLFLLNSYGWTVPKIKNKAISHYVPFLIAADYYLKNGDVYLKDHPQTCPNFFNEKIYGHVKTLDALVPIEFYCLIDKFRINKLVSINSTGNDKIAPFVNDSLKIGESFFNGYFLCHKLYISFLIDALFKNVHNYHYYGVDFDFLNNYLKIVFDKPKELTLKGIDPKILKGDIFTVIGSISEKNVKDIEIALLNSDLKTKVMFLDLDSLVFDNLMLLQYFIPITIHKHKIRDNTLSDISDEVILFFCKDQQTRNLVKNFTFEKELTNLGIKIVVNNSEKVYDLKDIKIKSLIRKLECLTAEINSLKGEN